MRRLVLSGAIAAIVAFGIAGPASAAGARAQVLASRGDPFAACVGVGADGSGLNHPNAEVEPWIADNPRSTRNLVATWQQDRWTDGGAKGLVAGWSLDGGRPWGETPLPFGQCAAPVPRQVAPVAATSNPRVPV